MTDAAELLPSWRAGATRDALLAFLKAAESLPVVDRVTDELTRRPIMYAQSRIVSAAPIAP